ncbi:MAG TPA: hypothetical protein VG097_05950, partial [Gemmata sp.]|nr:hypothetical protein [Gemmata sp.]
MFRSLATFSIVGLLALGTTVRAADDTPKDVILKAIKAHGGEDAITKNKAVTSKGKGKMMIPGAGEVEFTQETAQMLPDKFKESVQLSIAGQNISVITLVNGDKISIEAMGMDIKLDDKMKETI